jgi:hypothetical protein
VGTPVRQASPAGEAVPVQGLTEVHVVPVEVFVAGIAGD